MSRLMLVNHSFQCFTIAGFSDILFRMLHEGNLNLP